MLALPVEELSAEYPRAELLLPLTLDVSALLPMAVFAWPSESSSRASAPKAELAVPVVRSTRTLDPADVLLLPSDTREPGATVAVPRLPLSSTMTNAWFAGSD